MGILALQRGEDVNVGTVSSPDGFYIADEGEGIAEDEREDLSEPGVTRKNGGTGLGLSIVRDIVRAHGWEIGVTESSEGGARFEITNVEPAD